MSEGVVDLVCVGVKVRAHGIHGHVQVTSLSEIPDRFNKGMALEWRKPGQPSVPLTVRVVKGDQVRVRLMFDQVADRTAAEALNGGTLWGEPDTSALESDTFFYHQLLDLAVTDEEYRPLGTLTGVYDGAAHDLYEVTTAEGATFLVPAVSEFIIDVDPHERRMVIRPIPGLLPDAASG